MGKWYYIPFVLKQEADQVYNNVLLSFKDITNQRLTLKNEKETLEGKIYLRVACTKYIKFHYLH